MPPFDPEGSRQPPARSTPPARDALVYGAFRLDLKAKRLLRDGVPVPLKPLQFDILHALLSRPGELVTKNDLMKAGWGDRIVSDESVSQAVSRLRRVAGATELTRVIETATRLGYRFLADRLPADPPVNDAEDARDDADAVAGEHQAFMNGQAGLKTLTVSAIASARSTFESLIARHPQRARYHVGYANACLLTFEAARASAAPDLDLLRRAETHARMARHLAPRLGEAWATMGAVLHRLGRSDGAVAALTEAVTLQPDNWRHWLRLAYASWGQPCIDAARATLEQVPGCPMAHCLAAMVWVARGSHTHAERDVDAGLAALADDADAPDLPAIVAIYWLKGLLCLARGDVDAALVHFRRELALEARGHFYARECCANAWYAIGVCHLRRSEVADARSAFAEALIRVPGHPMAEVGMEMTGTRERASDDPNAGTLVFERVMARAARLSLAGDASGAARVIAAALASAPAGSAGWQISIDPLLGVAQAPDAWASVLGRLRDRAR